jgi:hypothetical protein
MKLADAIQALATTYQSLDSVARGLIVDAAEVHNALNTAEAGSMDELCLGYLAKYNPYTPPKKIEVTTKA